jgi:hypothetical protein
MQAMETIDALGFRQDIVRKNGTDLLSKENSNPPVGSLGSLISSTASPASLSIFT